MVTLSTAENALKNVYLGVVSEQLNISANPLLQKIKQSTQDVWGKEIIKLAPYGINGGIGAGDEDGTLPKASNNRYVQFKSDLKNLFGTIEISDKAIRASQSNAGAFVNLLNAEMEGLIKASSFNLGRMLYGNGSGILCTIAGELNENVVTVDDCRNLMEGMLVDIYDSKFDELTDDPIRIVSIDRKTKTVTLDTKNFSKFDDEFFHFVVQGSLNKEINGLGKVFEQEGTIYGLGRADYGWLNAINKGNVGALSDDVIQEVVDELEEIYDSKIDFIACSSDVKRAYQSYLATYRRNIDYMDLQGGFRAISYAGVPIVSDRFVESGSMYLLNSKEFTLHQLCDWQWLEGEEGRVIKQVPSKPIYTATLVKYADLICDKPNGQGKLSGITT